MPAPGETILYVRCADDADESARVYAFTAVPSNSLGADGDMAIIVNGGSSKLQQRIGGTWTDVAGGGGGSVSSVFGRTGAVVAVSGDYTSTTVTNSSGVSGATVTAALNTLDGQRLPAGGALGNVIEKDSGTDYDVSWTDSPHLTLRSSAPTTPGSNLVRVYARRVAAPALCIVGPNGVTMPLQTMLGTRNQTIIRPNTTTSVSAVGNTVTSVGTLSHPTPDNTYGWMTNFASAASANATAGTGNNGVLWRRGASSSSLAGFFFIGRIALPDASYDETGATTGSRIFVGLTSGTMAASVGSDTPTGDYFGFQRCHVNGGLTHTNWQVISRDNVTTSRDDTGLPFAAASVYQVALFCPPGSSDIYWRIDNITAGTTAEGVKSTNLPRTTINMRSGMQVATINAVARNIRMGILVTEDGQ